MIAFPQTRTCPYHPPAAYDPLREGPSLQRVQVGPTQHAWIVTGHEQTRELLADPRISSNPNNEGYPLAEIREGVLADPQQRLSMLLLDDPEHRHARRMVIPDFSVRRFRQMRPEIARIVNDTLDSMITAGSPADLVTAYSLPIPSLVICELLGVPYAEREFFQNLSSTMASTRDPMVGQAAVNELREYLLGLVADPPMPGLIRQLAEQRLPTGEMDADDIAATGVLLLFAGHETTASMISLSVLTLLEHPDQLAALKANPDMLPGAVEELLRFLSITESSQGRVALADIEIDGVVIKKGEGVLIGTSLANRDPAVFADPDTFDVHRDARGHVAFGYGVHQCLGQNLARIEMELALSILFERLPDLRLAVPADQVPVRPNAPIQGVLCLPVTW